MIILYELTHERAAFYFLAAALAAHVMGFDSGDGDSLEAAPGMNLGGACAWRNSSCKQSTAT